MRNVILTGVAAALIALLGFALKGTLAGVHPAIGGLADIALVLGLATAGGAGFTAWFALSNRDHRNFR